MASSSPPRDAISPRVLPPKTRPSVGDPFSPAFENALGFLDDVRDAGLTFAPIMPEPHALQAAALQAGITPRQALTAYLTVLKTET